MAIESSPKRYDIAIVSDFRYPGGTSSCIAQEIAIQARNGYTTALVHSPAPTMRRPRPFNPLITNCIRSGQAELVPANRRIHARLLLLHHPMVFREIPKLPPKIDAECIRLIVHQVQRDRRQEEQNYRVEAVDNLVTELFGIKPEWAPVGPNVRDGLIESGVPIRLSEFDWHNAIDTDEWCIGDAPPLGERPVIGRHGRSDPRKWPASAKELLRIYPDDGSVVVKVLGGGEHAEQLIGRKPRHWVVHPIGSISPRRFLADIDFFVYYHHPDLIEAFGQTILEALAAGRPAIVAPHFQRVFRDACVYAEPEDALKTVWALFRDREGYDARVQRGREFVRERFGLQIHTDRIKELIGPPGGAPRRITPPTAVNTQRPTRRRTVIFATSNGAGMGHITRILALARRAPETIRPVIVTMSTGMRVARELGFPAEFIPRHADWHWSEWNPFLSDRLVELIRKHDARTVVFDGNAPYQGVLAARERTGAKVIWMRRAMWRAGQGEKFIERGSRFDLILEPGEYAGESDRGLTVAERADNACVRPIVLLDEDELLPREEAKRELGLDPAKRAVLVQFGAGNVNDAASSAGITARRLVSEPETDVVVAEWIIADEAFELPDGIHRLRAYPIARYLRAFEFVIGAAGYNSFHDLIGLAVPAIFVPMETAMDDQHARTAYAAARGAALEVSPFTEAALESALRRISDPDVRHRLVERCRETFPGNGAQEAIDIITRVNAEAWGDAPTPHTVAETAMQPEATEALV